MKEIIFPFHYCGGGSNDVRDVRSMLPALGFRKQIYNRTLSTACGVYVDKYSNIATNRMYIGMYAG